MNLYRMNDYEWFCAETPEEALELYKKHLAACHGENSPTYKEMLEEDEPKLLTEEELNSHTFHEGDGVTTRTFKEELANRPKAGFFASTEF